MKKRISLLILAVLTAWFFAGCAPTINEMYRVPKRSKEFSSLQSSIDMAMIGLAYSAPVAGENRQSVQVADLNGDGVNEYLVFAKGSHEKPMQILIFAETEKEQIQIVDIIESNGFAFDQVEYADIDDRPGCELVVGRQVSDQVLRNLSVYTFSEGSPEQRMSIPYSKFQTCDLDSNGMRDLMVIQPGAAEMDVGIAMLYSFRDGIMARSVETELSQQVSNIKRIQVGQLSGGVPAVLVASVVDESAIVTDVLALKDGGFQNISDLNPSAASVQTLRNYYIYADDVDSDGILELPNLITTYSYPADWNNEQQYLIRWFSMDLDGHEVDKLYSFHKFVGGWYLQLEGTLAQQMSIEQVGSTYIFSLWNDEDSSISTLFTVYALTGSDRKNQAQEDSRFPLYSTENVVYAARLEELAAAYGITEELLVNSFRLIRQDWTAG